MHVDYWVSLLFQQKLHPMYTCLGIISEKVHSMYTFLGISSVLVGLHSRVALFYIE